MTTTTNEHWIEHRVLRGFDEVRDIYDLLDGRGYIAGSYAAYMTAPTDAIKPNDIDVFAVSNEAAESLATQINNVMGLMVAPASSAVAYTIVRSCERKDVQVVKPHPDWKVFPDDIINSFDMNVCRAVLITPDTLLGDIDAGTTYGKILRTHNPIRTLRRIMKYSQRGVQFTDHEVMKVFKAWEQTSEERKAELLDLAYHEAFPAIEDDVADYDYDSGSYDWEDEDDYFEGE